MLLQQLFQTGGNSLQKKFVLCPKKKLSIFMGAPVVWPFGSWQIFPNWLRKKNLVKVSDPGGKVFRIASPSSWPLLQKSHALGIPKLRHPSLSLSLSLTPRCVYIIGFADKHCGWPCKVALFPRVFQPPSTL